MFAAMWIDIVFALVAAYGFYWGYSRGIIGAVVSIAAVVLGFVLAVRFSAEVTDLLADLFNTPPTGAMPLVGFVVTFAMVLLALRLLVTTVERLLSTLRINFLNKAAGGLAAALLAVFVLSLAMLSINSAGLVSREAKADSVTYASLVAFPAQVQGAFRQSKPTLERIKDAGDKAMERGREQRERNER